MIVYETAIRKVILDKEYVNLIIWSVKIGNYHAFFMLHKFIVEVVYLHYGIIKGLVNYEGEKYERRYAAANI
jgi:hypothetical protein